MTKTVPNQETLIRPAHGYARLRRLCALLSAGWALACAPAPAGAQGEAPPCATGRISRIFIDTHSVFDLSDPSLSARFTWAYRLANGAHMATDADVIRREILVVEGDCYDVDRLRDSERLLRALDFIAEVDVFGVRQADSTVHVIVDTRDEWSLRVEPRVGGGGKSGLTGLRIREDNLFGTGNHLSAFYTDRLEGRVFGAAYRTPQLLGTRWDFGVEAGKTSVGHLLSQTLTYPFVGETGRWSLRQAVYHNDQYFEYRIASGEGITRVRLPQSRTTFDIGGVHRWGPDRYRRTVAGAVIRGERRTYADQPQYVKAELRTGQPPDLNIQLDSIENVRAMLLLGQRNVTFVPRRALDTVRGTEDVRLGVETEIALGPSVPLASHDRDLGFGFGLFAAGEVPGLGIGGTNLLVEARRDYERPASEPEWSDVFGHFSTWAYLRRDPEGRDLLVASLSAIGGWNARVPFQLTLGSETGLRGFPSYMDPGARRVVASVEQRHYLGWPLPDLFDLGTVVFADVGRMWAGNVPFGVSSPVRAGVGAGVRVAFPPGSRRTLRLDVGVPVQPGLQARDVEFSIGIGQWIGRGASLHDAQLDRSVHLWTRRTLLALPRD
ncbi:MAG: BamA/TamA family outer membrane protein [Gemmatimonadetes bacterium]|nr:BamA/TamA family outer membrane protein [Gemmatimonadota bacterium]